MNSDKDVAFTILEQLGGGRFAMMTGAKMFSAARFEGNPGLTFKIGRNDKGINFVRISLMPSDTYTMHFIKVRGTKASGTKVEDVYADMLQEIFTRHTGLYTRF